MPPNPLRWAAPLLLATNLLVCSPAIAQRGNGRMAPAGQAPESAPVFFAATSAPQLGTVTASAVTASGGAAVFASGVATIGPLVPELGRPVRVVLRLTGTLTFTAQVGTSVDGCVTINPLSVGGQTYGTFTGPANELVDEAWISGVGYCLTVSGISGAGTLAYAVRQ